MKAVRRADLGLGLGDRRFDWRRSIAVGRSQRQQQLIVAAAMLLYSTALLLAYRFKVSPVFSYAGLSFRDPGPLPIALSIGLVSLTSIGLPKAVRRPSDFLQWMLFALAGAPAILLAPVMQALSVDEALRMGVVVSLCTLLARIASSQAVNIPLPAPNPVSSRRLWLVLGIYSALTYAYLFAQVGVPTGWVSFSDVYILRADYTAAIGGSLLGYMLPVQYNVVNPVLIVRGVFTSNRILLALGLVGQTLVYLSEGQKGVLLSSAGTLALAKLFRARNSLPSWILPLGLGFVAATSLIVDWLANSIAWTSLFVRRFLIVPGALTVAYVSVFLNRPKTNFSELPFISTSAQFELAPTNLVGREFVGSATTNANVSIWGHGYLSAGYIGMAVIALLFVLVLWVADAVTNGLPPPVACLLFLRLSVVVASASLFTMAATHGLAVGLAVFLFLPRDNWIRDRVRQ